MTQAADEQRFGEGLRRMFRIDDQQNSETEEQPAFQAAWDDALERLQASGLDNDDRPFAAVSTWGAFTTIGWPGPLTGTPPDPADRATTSA